MLSLGKILKYAMWCVEEMKTFYTNKKNCEKSYFKSLEI